MTARYALYFTPCAGSPWARFGEAALLGEARRYGFHATLKAPFRLAAASRVDDVRSDLEALCASLAPFALPPLSVRRLDDFIALVPVRAEPRVDAIAAHCVVAFDRHRAPLDDAARARRRRRPLTPRQADYLERFGYPYVLDEFRFHLSLTGAPHAGAAAVPDLPAEPLAFDAISLMEEPAPGAAFRVLERIRFGARGRLLYVVGPSGAGKDSVLAWAREHLPGGAPVVFAKRAITRAPRGEDNRALSEEEFRAERAAGRFAMTWEAHGHRYGIGSEIRAWLAQGLTVVVSGSRAYLPHALADFPGLEVVHVTAAPEILRARIAARGREASAQLEQRLRRAGALRLPGAVRCTEIVNDAGIDAAGRALLERLLPPGPGR